MSHWEKLAKGAEIILNSSKPQVEEEVEKILGRFLQVPLVQEFFKIHPKIMTAVLSAGIGLIPEEMKRSPLGKFAIDMGETLPREILRILENQGAAVSGAGGKTATGATTASSQKLRAKGTTTSQPQKADRGTILAILDKKLIDQIPGFIEWFYTLTSEEQEKVEKHILSLGIEQIRIFVGIPQVERRKMLAFLKEEKKEEPVKKEGESQRISVVDAFRRSWAKHKEQTAPKKKTKTKHHGIITRAAHRIGGHPVNKIGRRIS